MGGSGRVSAGEAGGTRLEGRGWRDEAGRLGAWDRGQVGHGDVTGRRVRKVELGTTIGPVAGSGGTDLGGLGTASWGGRSPDMAGRLAPSPSPVIQTLIGTR